MNDTSLLSTNSVSNLGATISSSLVDIPVDTLRFPETLFYNNSKGDFHYLPYPPLVAMIRGSYYIIDGCRRVMHLKSTGVQTISCLLVNSDITENIMHFLRIKLNMSRDISLAEKILFIKWLKVSCDESLYTSLIASPPFTTKECREIELLPSITPEMLGYIDNGILDISVVNDYVHLDTSSQSALLSLFETLQFSRSTQREFIEWLPEIAYRDSTTIAQILSLTALTEIITHATLNAPQKVQKLRDLLYHKRFPLLSAARDSWTALARKMNPDPSRCQFVPNESFERNRLEVKITVTKHEEIETILEKLKNVSSDQWDKLIYPPTKLDSR